MEPSRESAPFVPPNHSSRATQAPAPSGALSHPVGANHHHFAGTHSAGYSGQGYYQEGQMPVNPAAHPGNYDENDGGNYDGNCDGNYGHGKTQLAPVPIPQGYAAAPAPAYSQAPDHSQAPAHSQAQQQMSAEQAHYLAQAQHWSAQVSAQTRAPAGAYGQAPIAQGYRTPQGQVAPAPAIAAKRSPPAHLPPTHLHNAPPQRPQPGSFGPAHPSQYVQQRGGPSSLVRDQVAPGYNSGGYGPSPVGQTLPPRGQRPPIHSAPPRPAPLRRRYEEEEDFVPDFGDPQLPVGTGIFMGLPVINWQNLPLGNLRFWTALGGIAFAAIMLNVLGSSPVISSIVKSRNRQCQEVIQPSSVLSRQQLTQLLTVPERSPKAQIHDIIREPYCTLPSLNIRAGVNALREAYPLEFDPDTWIVVLYEGDEYAGYRFNAR